MTLQAMRARVAVEDKGALELLTLFVREPRSRRGRFTLIRPKMSVVSCELYTERGSVPRRTGTVQARLHRQAAVERTSDKQSNKQAGLTRPAHVPVHTDISLG